VQGHETDFSERRQSEKNGQPVTGAAGGVPQQASKGGAVAPTAHDAAFFNDCREQPPTGCRRQTSA